MLVEEIMSRQVITAAAEASVLAAVELFRLHAIRHLPILEENRLVGIVSDRDLRGVVPSLPGPKDAAHLSSLKLREVMHHPVITAHPLDPIEDAARLMYQHRIGCLPVVSRGELVGIVTETDILRALVELLGSLRPGSRLEVEIPNRPGVLAEIGSIMRDHGINIVSVLTAPSQEEGRQILVLRLETINPREIMKEIEARGYRILWPSQRG